MALSPKQIQAAELLARGYSHQEVGDAIGASRRTILRWLKQQDFRDLSFGLTHRAPQPTPQPAPQRSPESHKQSNELTPKI
jgi:transposase